jgi:hypothetical protein
MPRFFTRQLTTRQVYRNAEGRFVSATEGLRQGIVPQVMRYYTYRDQRGRVRSEDFVRRQRQRIITVRTGRNAGQQLTRQSSQPAAPEPDLIQRPTFGMIQSQQVRSLLNNAVAEGSTVGVVIGGELYALTPDQIPDFDSFFSELEYDYIENFSEQLGGGVYMRIGFADSPSADVFNFDMLTATPDGSAENDPEFADAQRAFRQRMGILWHRYFN